MQKVLTKKNQENNIALRPPVDLDVLQRYTSGDKGLEREILELFCTVMPTHLDCLKHACSGEVAVSTAEWHLAIHTIKSSAATIGAWDVMDIAVRMLNMSLDQRTSAHCEEVAHLDEALAATFSQIELLIQSL